MSSNIQRVKAVKGANNRKTKDDDTEVDFYTLPPLDAKAEESLEARKKALREEASKPVKPKAKTSPKKRKRVSKSTQAQLKQDGPASSPTGIDEAKCADLEPTPMHPVLGQNVETAFPASPSSSRLLAGTDTNNVTTGNISSLLTPSQTSTTNLCQPSFDVDAFFLRRPTGSALPDFLSDAPLRA